jgi:hypothetical protein
MNELPSAQFRTTFHRLAEPTVVTALGRPIGTWTPGSHGVMHITQRGADQLAEQEARLRSGSWSSESVAKMLESKDEEIARLKRELAQRPQEWAGGLPPGLAHGNALVDRVDPDFTVLSTPGLAPNVPAALQSEARRSRQAVIDQALGKITRKVK